MERITALSEFHITCTLTSASCSQYIRSKMQIELMNYIITTTLSNHSDVT